jgi:hypothetical protein
MMGGRSPVMNRKILSFALAIGTCGVAVTARAAPPGKAECSASHARSQELRLDGKLLEARIELRTCSDSACPSALQADCAGWLAEVHQSIPSVEFLLEVPAGVERKPKVLVDGQALDSARQGEPFELNPGAHVFRFELEGYPVQEQTLVIRQGEKRRVLRVQFQAPAPTTPPARSEPVPAPAPPVVKRDESVSSRPIPVVTYVFAGVSVVAAGTGAYLGLDAVSTYSDREDSCAPNCPDGDVDQLKTQLLLADVAGGIAIVSAGVALYTFLTRPAVTTEKPPSSAGSLRIIAAPGGACVGLSGAF